MFLRNIILVLFLSISVVSQQNKEIDEKQRKIDSILLLRLESKDRKRPLNERFMLAERARRLSVESGIDSTIIKSNRRISTVYYEMKNFNLFKKINHETLKLAKKTSDSASIAKANFNLGNYFYNTLENDSAYYYYYNAEKMYTNLNDLLNAGIVLQNMAVIQQNAKDFIGSEKTAIKAVKYIIPFLKTNKNAYINLAGIYNNLGIVSVELDLYDEAIEYYLKASALRKEYEGSEGLSQLVYENNLGIVYEKLGNYDRSLNYFSNVLKNEEFLDKRSPFYARVLNNYARNRFLLDNEDTELPSLYMEALSIRESINDKTGVMRSNIDISNYYLVRNDKELARSYGQNAYNIAKKYKLYDDVLETLLLLSKVEKNQNKSLDYTYRYIGLSDSLQKVERAITNKFARIEFRTDQIEEQNVKISRERELFLILAIAGLVAAFLIYIIISQRSKNKELKFNQEQQKANEEIYNLMLSQQDKIDEGRAKEKQRISEDLHDGILGRLFGTRLSLDSLNMSSDDNAVKNRGQYIDELKSIEQEIRRISHDLNSDFVAGSGYLDIVTTLIENQTQAYDLEFDFTHKDEIDWERVSNKTKIHFYRMIQESLQNIYKHANAKQVDISFEMRKKQIFLSIVDDGEGFVVNKAKKGIGLKNIRSRVEELKGELFINSQKDAGTSISISVPL